MLSSMRTPPRRRSFARIIIAVVIALVAIARGGGIALACESFAPAADAPMTHGDHANMPDDAQPVHEGCDAPDRVTECLLMPACAPAVSTSAAMVAEPRLATGVIVLASPRAPAPVDRSPEPPPPRA